MKAITRKCSNGLLKNGIVLLIIIAAFILALRTYENPKNRSKTAALFAMEDRKGMILTVPDERFTR